jgi:hypothetical protein
MNKTITICLYLLFFLFSNGYGQEMVEFFNLQWRNDYSEIEEAHFHDQIRIRFETINISDGENIAVEIWEETDGILMDLITILQGTVKDNIVEIVWEVEYDKNNMKTNYAREIKEIGYTILDFKFIIKCNNISVHSKLLAILGYIYFQLYDPELDEPIRNANLFIITADNKRIQAESDENGYVLIKNLRMIRFIENFKIGEIWGDGWIILSDN